MSLRHRHNPRQRLNDHHADELLAIAKACAGHPDAVTASVASVDDEGIDLVVDTPGGRASVRVPFDDAGVAQRSARLRFRALARRARTMPAGGAEGPTSR